MDPKPPDFINTHGNGRYELGRTLASGSFGKVKDAVNSSTGERVAIKIINKESMIRLGYSMEVLEKEVSLLSCVNHPHIVRIIDYHEDHIFAYIVTELCSGDLLTKVATDGPPKTEEDAKKYFFQIMSAVKCLHDHGIVHRDIKPDNLLLDANDVIKLGDFGFATSVGSYDYLKTACGSAGYMPPEIYRRLQYNGKAADIWSSAITLYCVITGNRCYTIPSASKDPRYACLAQGQLPLSHPVRVFSGELLHIILSMCRVNPAERLTAHEVLCHPWLSNFKENQTVHIVHDCYIDMPAKEEVFNMKHSYQDNFLFGAGSFSNGNQWIDDPKTRSAVTQHQSLIANDVNSDNNIIQTTDDDSIKEDTLNCPVAVLPIGVLRHGRDILIPLKDDMSLLDIQLLAQEVSCAQLKPLNERLKITRGNLKITIRIVASSYFTTSNMSSKVTMVSRRSGDIFDFILFINQIILLEGGKNVFLL